MMKIPFNKPYVTGNELTNITDVISKGHLSGNGEYTKKCQTFFEKKYGFKKTLLTTSCTDALEMCALLINIIPGDEVIIPSYTFVSTALVFARQGAKVVFADSSPLNPNIEIGDIEARITDKTKAIVPVHYAGIAVDMDEIMRLANKYDLYVIEDAAQSIDSFYYKKPLGGIGHLGVMSFHETKNITSGEGGLLIVNDDKFIDRAEIIWEKGTNRSSFFRGEINKYGWVDIGSSFLPSELNAAFLYAQLLQIEIIQQKRISIWETYYKRLKKLENEGKIKLPYIPEFATNNAHMFYLLCNSEEERTRLIKYLKEKGIQTVFHYLGLNNSLFYQMHYKDIPYLRYSDYYTDCLLRLPMYTSLLPEEIEYIIQNIFAFYE